MSSTSLLHPFTSYLPPSPLYILPRPSPSPLYLLSPPTYLKNESLNLKQNSHISKKMWHLMSFLTFLIFQTSSTFLIFPIFLSFPTSFKSAWAFDSKRYDTWCLSVLTACLSISIFLKFLKFFTFLSFLKFSSSLKSTQACGSENIYDTWCLSVVTFLTFS